MELLFRRRYAAARLVADHPPRLRDGNKQLVFALTQSGPAPAGELEVTRWQAAAVPVAAASTTETEIVVEPGYYVYADDPATWHVNFADPALFCAYGSPLLAQDELQCAEHPALASVREALRAEGLPAETEGQLVATPILVANVERRCALDTAPAPGRSGGLYGNRFAAAAADQIRAAVAVLRPPTHTNLIAIAAPTGHGVYTRATLDGIVQTAYTGFAAAVHESAARWPGAPVEIRTGFWGCGAFGGNRHVMAALQIHAARLAGVACLRFYAADDAGMRDVKDAQAILARADRSPDPIGAIAELRLVWGVGNGT